MSDDPIIEAVKNASVVTFETEAPKKGKGRARGKGGGAGTPSDEGGGRRLIQFAASRPDIAADEAEAALIASGLPVFQRGGELVEPCVERALAYGGGETQFVTLQKIGEARVIDLLAQCTRWEKFDKRDGEYVPIAPPRIVAQILLDRRGTWRIRRIAGVVEHQTMRPDGSLVTAPGYDERTQLYLALDPRIILPEIPAYPSYEHARQAVELIGDLLSEFSFKDKDLDFAAALSATMTPVLRPAMDSAPLHVVSSSTYGSGKSYSVSIPSAICTGRPAPVITASGEAEELEKRLDSALLSGKPMIVIDNANGELGGDKLAIAIDQPLISVRPLGASKTVEIENRASLYATGVNCTVRGDLVRRTLTITLEPQEERPEARVFAHDPLKDVLANRGKYIAAVLTIAAAYLAAGEPGVACERVASFGAWSRFIQRPLVWLGHEDVAGAMRIGEALDSERAAIEEVMAAWPSDPEGKGLTVSTLVSRANADDELKNALLGVAGSRDKTINPLRLSKWLRRHAGRIVEGAKIVSEGKDLKRKSPCWRVVSVL
jgi:putative DNA primase/helicase